MKGPSPSPADRSTNVVPPRAQPFWTTALVLSAVLNLVLLLHLRARHVPGAASVVPTEESFAQPGNRAEAVPNPPKTDRLEWHWDNLASLDFRTLRSRLLETGCPEHTVRAILEVAIDRKYRPGLADLFRRTQTHFWEQQVVVKTGRSVPRTPEQTKAEQAFSLLQQERDRVMKELVGPDWDRQGSPRLQDREQTDPRLSFLSEEQRQRIEEQQKAVSELRQSLSLQGIPEADVNMQMKSLQAEHELEWSQFLSPEEAEEYRLRRSPFNHVAQNLYSFEPSSHERQAIIHLHEAYDGKVPDAELEKALGSERFVQYQRARDRSYESIYKVGSYLKLPEEQMIRTYELKQAAEERAKAIRGQRDLDNSQKAELLDTLEHETLEGLAIQFGLEGRDLYLRKGGWWVNELAGLKK